MSRWTHVAGCIRVDRILFEENQIKDDYNRIQKILGRIVEFNDETYETTLPCGSEGSIRYTIVEKNSELPGYDIAIYGDLRDFTDVKYTKEWFQEVCQKLDDENGDFWIRSAVLRVDVEAAQDYTEIFSYNTELYSFRVHSSNHYC